LGNEKGETCRCVNEVPLKFGRDPEKELYEEILKRKKVNEKSAGEGTHGEIFRSEDQWWKSTYSVVKEGMLVRDAGRVPDRSFEETSLEMRSIILVVLLLLLLTGRKGKEISLFYK